MPQFFAPGTRRTVGVSFADHHDMAERPADTGALLSPAITILAISTHEINRPPRPKHRWGSDTSVMTPIPPTLWGVARDERGW